MEEQNESIRFSLVSSIVRYVSLPSSEGRLVLQNMAPSQKLFLIIVSQNCKHRLQDQQKGVRSDQGHHLHVSSRWQKFLSKHQCPQPVHIHQIICNDQCILSQLIRSQISLTVEEMYWNFALAAKSSETKIELDSRLRRGMGGFSSCMCCREQAVPMIILIQHSNQDARILPLHKIKHSISLSIIYCFKVKLSSNLNALILLTMKMLIECTIGCIFKDHHSHKRLILLTVTKETDKVFVVHTRYCIYLYVQDEKDINALPLGQCNIFSVHRVGNLLQKYQE